MKSATAIATATALATATATALLAALVASGILSAAACGSASDAPPPCDGSGPKPSRAALRCEAEFLAQAARPLDSSVPGARTIKTIVDRAAPDPATALHFMDTTAFPVHSRFATLHLGYPPGTPFVNEYFSPQRRLLLGSVTHYEEPDVWAYELAPYDTASVEQIADAYRRIATAAYFGAELRFHPTSEEQVARAALLPDDVRVITTDEIYAGISYQPLNLGETYAQVRVLTAAELATTYVSPRELVVLDTVPNDLSVVAGVVTAAFQTPLSHVNVLSQQRGTPNMGLRGAAAVFTPFVGKWVRLRVGAFDWSLDEVTVAEADAWFAAHRPPTAEIPAPDYTVTATLDIDDVGAGDVTRVGGKAANFGELRNIAGDVVVRDALAIPVYRYKQFLEQNGFDVELAALLVDEPFRADGNVRRARLADLQARMLLAPVDAVFLAELEARLTADFPATRMKFRSSTNAEDLARHTGAGLYDSKSGQPGDPTHPVDVALRTVWASTWNFRAFEERAYVGIDHLNVAMAVLVNPTYPDELANGVAVTANVYDFAAGGEDAFYVNAQVGETSVVQPDPTMVADQLMYYFFHNGQPATYYTRSTLLGAGQATVLTRAQLFDLGRTLAAIRDHFDAIYDPPAGWGQLPMDVEWKLVGDAAGAHIEIKQARPFPGRGVGL